MDEDLVKQPCVEYLLCRVRAKNHSVLIPRSGLDEIYCLVEVATDKGKSESSGDGIGMCQDKLGSSPCPAVNFSILGPGSLISASTHQDCSNPTNYIVSCWIRTEIFTHPPHGVARSSDESIQRHRVMPKKFTHP